jgi:hypothetical protein
MGFHKMLGNYRVSKQLGISQVVLSSMELVVYYNVEDRVVYVCVYVIDV